MSYIVLARGSAVKDLSYIVNVDGTSKAAANTPLQPDPEAYDEKGASPGRAWVGFSSSTSYFQFQQLGAIRLVPFCMEVEVSGHLVLDLSGWVHS